MTQINLLPWREKQREQYKREFFIALAISALLGISLMLFIHFTVAGWTEQQYSRNALLQQEIRRYETQVEEIKQLISLRDSLLSRINTIYNLQASRPQIVHFFDELVSILPEGVYLKQVKRTGNMVVISGYAQSNTDISQLMRNVEVSQWLGQPLLNEIKESTVNGQNLREFSMQLSLIIPRPSADEENIEGWILEWLS